MSIIRSRAGEELLEFHPGAIPHRDLPLVFACVIASYKGDVLFMFNRLRDGWELPAGLIESGETPLAAAQRELKEETGPSAPKMTCAGSALLALPPDGRLEYGAIYTCDLEDIQPFEANDEAAAIMFWDFQRQVEGAVDEIARALPRLMKA